MSTENITKSVHQRLLNIRDTTGEQFNHLLMRYGLERLLYRIQAAGHADTFVLKGAIYTRCRSHIRRGSRGVKPISARTFAQAKNVDLGSHLHYTF